MADQLCMFITLLSHKSNSLEICSSVDSALKSNLGSHREFLSIRPLKCYNFAMEQHKKQLVINGQLINYYKSGECSKAMIFLHGWRSSSEAWFGVLPQLTKAGFSIFCIDLPGFGGSPAPMNPYSVDDYADIVREFISKQKLEKATIVGHSFGGRVAIKLAVTSSEIVDSLILVDSAGIKRSNSMRRIMAQILRPIFKSSVMRGVRHKIYQRMGSEDYLATPELKQTYLKVIKEDLTNYFSEIKAPTLLVWGAEDKDTPVNDAYVMVKAIPNSELRIIKDAGHFSFIDKPEEFVTVLESFFAGGTKK